MMNLCQELRCPHALKNGCDQFSLANHCPLVTLSNEIQPNQYWLFAEEDADLDINDLRDHLDFEVLIKPSSQRRLWARVNMEDKKPVMVWEG